MRRVIGAALLALLSLPALMRSPSPAAAQERRLEPAPGTSSDFWREVRRPGYRRSRTLLRHGLRLLDEASRGGRFGDPQRALRSAITRLRLAQARAPDDPEVLYYLAHAVAQWPANDPEAAVERRTREAVRLFESLRALDSDYQAQVVAFQLGVLHTRLRDLNAAVEEYHRAIEHAFSAAETTTTHANLAEVTMLLGNLRGAIEHYERAIAIARSSGSPRNAASQALAHWGLAVALDRMGDHQLAEEKARMAYSLGNNSMHILESDGVFFEPEYELHYYQGLGHLIATPEEAPREERIDSLRRARSAFGRYLDEGGRDGPFADAARERARRITELLETLRSS